MLTILFNQPRPVVVGGVAAKAAHVAAMRRKDTMDLRQNTEVVVSFGPFDSASDAVTPVTSLASALDHATTGIKISKNGGDFAVRDTPVVPTTYEAQGFYEVTLTVDDVNTLGRLRMVYTDPSTILPVWQDFMVLPQAAWDQLYSSGTDMDNLGRLGSARVTVQSPLASDSSLTLITGDAYYTTDGRDITWTDSSATWPNIVGGVASFNVGDGTLVVTATVVDADTIRLELTAAQTATLTQDTYRYDVSVVLSNGHKVTLVRGILTVLDTEAS